MEPDKVTIRNTGDTTVTLGDVEIEAGKSVEVDKDLAYGQLGSGPGPADNAEINRVQTIWGYYAGLQPDSTWADAAPSLEVHDSEGNRLWLLHDDPTGENAAAEAAEPKKAKGK